MNSLLSFLSSSLFSNFLAIVGIFLAFLPQKSTVSIDIDHSKHYYFENSNSNKKDSQTDIFFGALALIFTYILYSFLQPYFPSILIILSFCLIIKYRLLKINYWKQMIIPVFLILLSIISHYWLPKDVFNYWNQAYKIDLDQMKSLSQLLNQLFIPIKELINLFSLTPLYVAILANMFFVFLATSYIFMELVQPKYKIKIIKNKNLIPILIIFLIIFSFMFYTIPNFPSRILIEHIKNFLSN